MKASNVERHLLRRRYQTARGRWNTLDYASFTDWKGKPRKFPIGSDLKTAREELSVLEARNIRKEDFDKQATARITFSKWSERYLELVKNKRSLERDERSCRRLEQFFGQMLLTEITRSVVMEYKNLRLEDPIIRRGAPVEGSVLRVSTVNRELACLRHMLKLAEDDGLIESAPRIKLDSERKFARKRVVSDAEYDGLLQAAPRYLQGS